MMIGGPQGMIITDVDFALPGGRLALLGATADHWDEACRAAGTSPEAVEDALARRLAG